MMLPYGYSNELKDKRVDKILLENGVKLEKAEIFYSPISGCAHYLGLLIVLVMLPNIFYSLYYMGWLMYNYFWLSLASLLLISPIFYVFLAYANVSFVVVENDLYCINPNPPFRFCKCFKFSEIEKITVRMGLFNYVKIKTANKSQRFYCYFLQPNAYDENITALDLDDFHTTLRNNQLPVLLLERFI